MVALKGEHIYLRALEPEDLDFLYLLENDARVWEVSMSQTPYSRYILKKYLKNSYQDIYEAKQLRLAICKTGEAAPIGLVDLFEFEPAHSRAGVGIIIYDEHNRNKGIGAQALQLVSDYAFTTLHLHQLYANIDNQNTASKALFTTFGFKLSGIKKDWIKRGNAFHDEALYQLIR